jgi:hypothetical protein
MAQAVELLLSKHKAEFKPQSHQKKKKKYTEKKDVINQSCPWIPRWLLRAKTDVK